MPHSNGRIYTEIRNGVRYGVTTEDVAAVLGQASLDVAKLCRASNINPWARYKPIPCVQSANNTPQSLTQGQRAAERYGIEPPIDMFTADDVQQFEDYANDIDKHGAYYINMRPWASGRYHRLLDFVKTDINRAIVDGVGYDHLAQPDGVVVTISTGTAQGSHRLAPLIPEGQRTIYAPAGSTSARFMFPNDHIWMNVYYQWLYGTTSEVVSVEQHEEWLSPIDFMGTNTYSSYNYASVVRRILVFRWEDSQHRIDGDAYYDEYDARWRFWNYATDTDGTDYKERSFADHPLAWLDLTDSEQNRNTRTGERRFKDLEGRCLFIDCWIQSNSSVNLMPIVGFAYEVNVYRSGGDMMVDVSGVLTFVRVEEVGGGSDGYDYVVFIDYAPEQLGLPAGLVDAGVQAVGALDDYYDSLQVTIGQTTVDMLDTTLNYMTDTHGSGDWFSLSCVVLENIPESIGATATITATRKNAPASTTKTIQITQ